MLPCIVFSVCISAGSTYIIADWTSTAKQLFYNRTEAEVVYDDAVVVVQVVPMLTMLLMPSRAICLLALCQQTKRWCEYTGGFWCVCACIYTNVASYTGIFVVPLGHDLLQSISLDKLSLVGGLVGASNEQPVFFAHCLK